MDKRLVIGSLMALLLLTVIIAGCSDSDDDDNGPANSPPVAVIGPNQSVMVNTVVYFDGTGSYDPDNDALSYQWNFGDGSTGSGATPSHTYTSTGSYTVSMTVTANGGSDTDYLVVTVTSDPAPPASNKWAVVIGISNYPSNYNDLLYCVDDALDWQAHLENEGYTVYSLIDSEAKHNKITGAINWMRSNAQPGDSCAFIYSGHGVNYNDIGYSGTGSVLISYDGYIFDYDLASAFSNFPTQRVFFFFDACRSGDFDELYQSGRFVTEGCDVNEYTFDGDDSMSNGVFTYYFLEKALIQNNYPSLEGAFQYAYSKCAASPWYFHPEMYDGDTSQAFIL